MNENEIALIKKIKTKIIAMLEERQAIAEINYKIESPSALWASALKYSAYVLWWLAPEAFSELRLHTYHFTGDDHLNYDGDPQAFRIKHSVDDAWKDIPQKYIVNEPSDGIGYHYPDGRFVSIDSLRCQHVIATLYRQGIISFLEKKRGLILEIGAGYGGLLYQLSNILGKATCVIVDLPEILLFSASYLSLHNPNKKIYLYDKEDFAEFINSDNAKNYDFILIPNYRLDSLKKWKFDLILNITSMQEMRIEQVENYLDFISSVCTGVFYTWNHDRHRENKELTSISELLAARFELTEIIEPIIKVSLKGEIVRFLSAIARAIHLLENPKVNINNQFNRKREYICKPIR